MQKIVVGVDGSKQSREALHWAVEEAGARGAAVVALHAYVVEPPAPDASPAPPFDLPALVTELHEGAVTFEADIDLAQGTNKCNCSICMKTRNWNAIVKPAAFRLLAGEADLSDYQFGAKVGHHYFCSHCGVRSFGKGYVEQIGGHYVAVQLGSLDNVSPDELAAAPVRYADGRNNDWGVVPPHTAHL